MFSLIVAWIIFVISTVVIIYVLWDEFVPKSKMVRAIQAMENSLQGYTTKTDWRKVFIYFVAWSASGIYIFG